MDMDQHVLLIARLITRNKTDAEVSDVGECVVDRVGPRGSTALAMACATGHLAEAEALLGANCDPNLECCAFEDKYTAAEKHVGEKLLCTALARSQTVRGGHTSAVLNQPMGQALYFLLAHITLLLLSMYALPHQIYHLITHRI